MTKLMVHVLYDMGHNNNSLSHVQCDMGQGQELDKVGQYEMK